MRRCNSTAPIHPRCLDAFIVRQITSRTPNCALSVQTVSVMILFISRKLGASRHSDSPIDHERVDRASVACTSTETAHVSRFPKCSKEQSRIFDRSDKGRHGRLVLALFLLSTRIAFRCRITRARGQDQPHQAK